ncbi:MAG: phosphoribosyl-AMP cyclohydrolase [Roseibacillus sp.]|nr:phosphoribosyl-AMP cyclohydrolase [Roseibacillus sp.]
MSNQDQPKPVTFSTKDSAAVDETDQFCPKFDSKGLIPAIAIDAETKEPLMLAWMNEQSLKQTLQIGEAVYYSRSRQEIWHKGATSGHTQKILEIRTDCDQDALILYVDQQGAGACHTGRRSCFYRSVTPGDPSALAFWGKRTFDPAKVYSSE